MFWNIRLRKLERAVDRYFDVAGPDHVNKAIISRVRALLYVDRKNRREIPGWDKRYFETQYEALMEDIQSEYKILAKKLPSNRTSKTETNQIIAPRPPFNAEYLLYLLLRREERNIVIGDLLESYGLVLQRFNKRRADFWFCKQVAGSLFPLLRRAVFRIGAVVWLGRILRRLIS